MRPKIHLPRKEIIKEYEKGRSCKEISKDYNVSRTTISRRLKDWGVEMKDAGDYTRVEYAKFKTTEHGYEIWKARDGEKTRSMLVHRLIAVSEFGLDSVKNNEVHHKNGVSWDNRPENLTIMSKEEHTSHHMAGHSHNNHWKEMERDENGRFK